MFIFFIKNYLSKNQKCALLQKLFVKNTYKYIKLPTTIITNKLPSTIITNKLPSTTIKINTINQYHKSIP